MIWFMMIYECDMRGWSWWFGGNRGSIRWQWLKVCPGLPFKIDDWNLEASPPLHHRKTGWLAGVHEQNWIYNRSERTPSRWHYLHWMAMTWKGAPQVGDHRVKAAGWSMLRTKGEVGRQEWRRAKGLLGRTTKIKGAAGCCQRRPLISKAS